MDQIINSFDIGAMVAEMNNIEKLLLSTFSQRDEIKRLPITEKADKFFKTRIDIDPQFSWLNDYKSTNVGPLRALVMKVCAGEIHPNDRVVLIEEVKTLKSHLDQPEITTRLWFGSLKSMDFFKDPLEDVVLDPQIKQIELRGIKHPKIRYVFPSDQIQSIKGMVLLRRRDDILEEIRAEAIQVRARISQQVNRDVGCSIS